jgi:putative redox protein
MAYVTVINEHQHLQQIVSGHHHLTADEPVAAGGSDAGLGSRELLLASLGADTAVALRRHAAVHDWTLGRITVGVRWSKDDAGKEHIERRLAFGKPLSGEQKKQLLGVAAASEVSKVLSGGIAIQSTIVD